MDKSKNLFFAFIALAAVSCAPNTDNNHGLEYDSLEVNFSASKSGDGWAADDVVGGGAYDEDLLKGIVRLLIFYSLPPGGTVAGR